MKTKILNLSLWSFFIYLIANSLNLFNSNLIISWNQLHHMYKKNQLNNEITLYDDYALIESQNKSIIYQINIPNQNYIQEQINSYQNNILNIFCKNLYNDLNILYYKPSLFQFIFNNISYIVIIICFIFMNLNKNFTIGNSLMDFKIHTDKDKSVKIDDVGGSFNSKKELLDLVNVFKKYDKFLKLGGRAPKGILLEGPPGTGKTMVSRAIANELDMTFIVLSGSDIIKPIVGLGTMFIKEVFKKAKENLPCIIFIDEIDAIAKSRDNVGSGLNERDNILNSLLVEMDGFNQNNQILVIGATNRSDILDKAILRPGRFDRIVKFSLPSYDERYDIFSKLIKKYKIEEYEIDDCKIKSLSHQTHSFSGADIENLFVQSSIEVINQDKDKINYQNIIESLDFVQLGSIVKHQISQKELKIIAIHESGHALIANKLNLNVEYVTIVPRSKGALGFTKIIPTNDQLLHTYDDFFNQICILLGGRISELIMLNEITEGASDDLTKATKLANQMVKKFSMKNADNNYNQNLLLNENNFYNENSQYLIENFDKYIIDLLNEAEKKTKEIIQTNKFLIESMSNKLLETKSINKDQIDEIFKI